MAMNSDETKLFYRAAELIATGEEGKVLDGINSILEHNLTEGADVITHCLAHESSQVKLSAIRAMGDLRAPATISSLTALLATEEDTYVRATAAIALGSTQERKALPALTNLLQDSDARVRANAVEAITQLGDPATVSLLTPMLDDENHRVKVNVAMALWQFGGLKMLNVLKRMLKSGGDKWQRASAAYALGEIGGFQTMATLIEALDDHSAEVRRNVIKSLGKMGALEINRELMPFLDDDDPHIRASTVEALGNLDGDRNIEAILDRLKVEKEELVLSKAQALLNSLVGSGNPSVVKELKELLASRNPRDQAVKGLIVEVFGESGSEGELLDLQNIIRSLAPEDVKEAARRAVTSIKGRTGLTDNPALLN